MAQTSAWLTVGEAAVRLHRTEREVLALVYAGVLESRLDLDHYDVSKQSVEAYADRLARAESASELATPQGDVLAEHAGKPAWQPWTDPDFRREQADYTDTPSDEGDDT